MDISHIRLGIMTMILVVLKHCIEVGPMMILRTVLGHEHDVFDTCTSSSSHRLVEYLIVIMIMPHRCSDSTCGAEAVRFGRVP